MQPGGVVSRALRCARLVAGAALVAFCAGFLAFAANMMRYDRYSPVSGDAVVVLTGGELRVREGLRLFAGGAGRRLLISGVNRATTRDDLRRLAGVQPILFDCCVDVGYLALDTNGNAVETQAWLKVWDFRRLVVVTSNYHMARSLAELGRALPNVELVPHAVVSRAYQGDEWWRHPGAIKLVATEYMKFIPAAVRWGLSRMLPDDGAMPVLPPNREREVHSKPRQVTGL
jgi:uncharacterized SAM-binding protein YcdF (DUF218 family)